jgi:hypothetical protein
MTRFRNFFTAALLALFVWPAHAMTFDIKQIDLKPLALQLRRLLFPK